MNANGKRKAPKSSSAGRVSEKEEQEIQKAETMTNARQGDRIKIEMSGKKSLVGKITKIKDSDITLETEKVKMTLNKNVIKEKNWKIKAAPPVPKAKTMEFAREKTKEIMGETVTVAGAANDRTYSGKIVGMTEGYAIQSLNKNSAILHKLEDLSKANTDGKGQIKVSEGESLSITRDAFGVVSLAPFDKEREKKERERQRILQRGSQQIGSRSL
jgi:preprotein translocase subunit YajC